MGIDPKAMADIAGKDKAKLMDTFDSSTSVTSGQEAGLGADASKTSQPTDKGVGGTDDLPTQPGVTPGGSPGSVAKKGAVASAVAAAPAAAQTLSVMVVLNWLKTMLMQALAVAQAFLSSVWGALVVAGKAVTGFFTTIGAFVSTATSGLLSSAAATGISVLATLGLVVSAGVGLVSVSSEDTAARDGALEDCAVEVNKAADQMASGATDTTALQDNNAKYIYSVLAPMGAKDETIAALIGNAGAESSIDFTAVETIYNEPGHIGSRKKDAFDKGFDVGKVAPEYASQFGGVHLLGIGMWQWSNGRNTSLLEFAQSVNKNWYDPDVQIAFLVGKDNASDVALIQSMMKGEGISGVDSAVEKFMWEWERPAQSAGNASLSHRKEIASKYYAQMKSWEKNETLANSIMAMANTSASAANTKATASASEKCKSKSGKADNSNLVNAAISYAWPHNNDGVGNDGTDMYIFLHKKVLGEGDPYFASCDRTVATAVRWSGTDDTYPAGGVQQQLAYVIAHPEKWKKVDYNGDKSKLQPGDILLRNDDIVSHTVIYVGEDALKAIWGEGNYEPSGEIVSGSLNDRSPSVGQFYTGGDNGLNVGYSAYRNIEKESASEYTKITVPPEMGRGKGSKKSTTTPNGSGPGE